MDASPGASSLAARLFEQHGPSIYRYFRRLTADRAVAEDLFQEVFLRVVRHAGAYEPRERERAWIFRIARNVLLDHNRTGRHTPAVSARLEPVASASQGVQSDLRLALAALGADDREAFLLAEVGGLTYVGNRSGDGDHRARRAFAHLSRAARTAQHAAAAGAPHPLSGINETRR